MTTAMKVESNIPMPSINKSGRGRPVKYPFAQMKISDSFYVPSNKAQYERIRNTLTTSAHHYVKRHKKTARFSTRREGNGIRIWRIK